MNKQIPKTKGVTLVRSMPKIGRNQICPLCSSGKKFKKCCLGLKI